MKGPSAQALRLLNTLMLSETHTNREAGLLAPRRGHRAAVSGRRALQ